MKIVTFEIIFRDVLLPDVLVAFLFFIFLFVSKVSKGMIFAYW